MKSRDLEIEDLGEYSNYKEQINNLDKKWEINRLKDNIRYFIYEVVEKKREQDKQDKQDIDSIINNFKEMAQQPLPTKIINDDSWNQQREKFAKYISKLENENKTEELTKKNKQLEEVIKELEAENEQLKKEIQELKAEKDDSPEYYSYIKQKETELQNKQSRLEQLKSLIKVGNFEKQKSKSNNFPTNLVIGGATLMIVGLMVVLVIRKKRKK